MDSSDNDTQRIPPNGVGALPFTPLHAPNAVFVAIFTILFAIHLGLAVKFWRYYGYAIGMVCGLLLEMLGYIAKVQLSNNRKDKNGYIMYEALQREGCDALTQLQVHHRAHAWTDIFVGVAIPGNQQPATVPSHRQA